MAINTDAQNYGPYSSDHAPTDADFDAPVDGMCVNDVENNHYWVRCKGVWVQFI